MHERQHNEGRASVLASLRSLMPARRLTLGEAIQVAELQAARLLKLQDVDDIPVPNEIITSLPRVVVEHDRNLPPAVSGCSDWDRFRHAWVISINPKEPRTRRRLTILHEFKHIIDHTSAGLVRPQLATTLQMAPDEYVADYFAGCVLMPRRQLKVAWGNCDQSVEALAQLFDVSTRAMQVRLNQTGLLTVADEPPIDFDHRRPRTGSAFRPHRYHRYSNWSCPIRTIEVAS
jgi:hypothetical protein